MGKAKAAFKLPRPSGEAASKGTMASKNGVQKRTAANKTATKKLPSKKSVAPRKATKSDAPSKTTKRALSEASDSDTDEDTHSGKATTAKQSHKPQAARGRSSTTHEVIIDSDSESAGSQASSTSEPDTTLASRRASAHHGGSTAGAPKAHGTAVDDGPPPIPQKLLTRLLYEGFEDKGVKIGREAMAVYGKYVETFVREALARAIFEREDADKEGAGVGDGFVQVEDLERITPQLVLDF